MPNFLKPRIYTNEEVLAAIELVKQTIPGTWSAFLDVELGKTKVTKEEYLIMLRPMFALFKAHDLVDSANGPTGLLMKIRTQVRK